MTDPTPLAVAIAAARAADDKLADDVTVIDVGPILSICDYFVICSAKNTRLVAAVAQEVEDQIAILFDRRPISVEGLDDRRWALVDFGDVVVHVFAEEERAYYRLEKLYGDAERVEWHADTMSGQAVGDPA